MFDKIIEISFVVENQNLILSLYLESLPTVKLVKKFLIVEDPLDPIYWDKHEQKNLMPDFFKDQSFNVNSLVGKYIVYSGDLVLGKIDEIISYDLISDFHKELISYNGGWFYSKYPIYEFLRFLKYKLTPDLIIELQKEFSDYTVNSQNLCFRKNLSSQNHLTLENVDYIYETFYKDDVIGYSTDKTIYNFHKAPLGITATTYKTDKNTGRRLYGNERAEFYILRLGEKLPIKQKND